MWTSRGLREDHRAVEHGRYPQSPRVFMLKAPSKSQVSSLEPKVVNSTWSMLCLQLSLGSYSEHHWTLEPGQTWIKPSPSPSPNLNILALANLATFLTSEAVVHLNWHRQSGTSGKSSHGSESKPSGFGSTGPYSLVCVSPFHHSIDTFWIRSFCKCLLL